MKITRTRQRQLETKKLTLLVERLGVAMHALVKAMQVNDAGKDPGLRVASENVHKAYHAALVRRDESITRKM